MVKNFRPSLAFLSGLLCALCLALSAVAVAYADDWQEKEVKLTDSSLELQRMIEVNGTTTWLDANNTSDNGTGLDTVNSIGLQINNAPGFGASAFALKGRISLSFVATSYGDDFSFSSAYGYMFHPDGSAEVFNFSASPRWANGDYWIDMDIDIRSSRTVSRIAFWMVFPSNLGTTHYAFYGLDQADTTDLVVGYGSALSPTFPGSGLTTSDLPHDAVSRMDQLESTIHEGTTYNFDQANDIVGHLPDRLDEWGSSFSFVRLLTSNFIDRLPWLDTLLSVSLALGVIALLLNLSAWIGRASKK